MGFERKRSGRVLDRRSFNRRLRPFDTNGFQDSGNRKSWSVFHGGQYGGGRNAGSVGQKNFSGNVVDVYISKNYNYAFVRYKSEDEMKQAIFSEDNQWIDSRRIRVKKAEFGWSSKRSGNEKSSREKALVDKGKKPLTVDFFSRSKDGRSYKDVVLGVQWERGESSGSKVDGRVIQKDRVHNESLPYGHGVEFKLEIPEAEGEWLRRCLFGRLKPLVCILDVERILSNRGVNCKVSSLGGVSFCLLFDSLNLKLEFLKNKPFLWRSSLCLCLIGMSHVLYGGFRCGYPLRRYL
ncbi:hypothetical protein PTKIN_Ptkin14bG0183600 [Pterospermum kingtungense]